MLIYLNGKYYNENKAAIGINNRSFRYGDGFFETILYKHNTIVNEALHFDRVFRSMLQLCFDYPGYLTPQFLASVIHELVRKNNLQKLARVRLTIFRGNGGLYDADNMHANILVQTWPIDEQRLKLNVNGLVLGIANIGFKAADALANIKSNNYLLYAMAAHEAKQRHWNDAIVLNHFGRVADSTIANVWIIKQDVIFTALLSEGPVAGVVRQHLINSSHHLPSAIVEDNLTVERLLDADGIFVTNAIIGLKWVKELQGKTFELHPFVPAVHQFLQADQVANNA